MKTKEEVRTERDYYYAAMMRKLDEIQDYIQSCLKGPAPKDYDETYNRMNGDYVRLRERYYALSWVLNLQ